MRRPKIVNPTVLPMAALLVAAVCARCGQAVADEPEAGKLLQQLGVRRGICVVLGSREATLPLALARSSELAIYVQSDDARAVAAMREAVAAQGLLGTRIWIERGNLQHIHLASNLADGLILAQPITEQRQLTAEMMRVLHPGGAAIGSGPKVLKPRPPGSDDWSHPYHGPDNNPQSSDQLARWPSLTQFLCEPWYVPMPQVTVASGGRVFKAFGHIALKQREWPWLNKLVAINGYNGTMLWTRPLKPGFMIHRNTLAATPDTLYLADDESCKRIDAQTGMVRDQIEIPVHVDADGAWKWLALHEGVLYALVGAKEPIDTVIRGGRIEPGWPWSGLGAAYAGQYPWGFGRTLLAMNPQTRQILWTYKSAQPIDSRAMCMSNGRIFLYSHQNYLACVDASTGQPMWRTVEQQVLEAIGEHDRAQTPRKGFASTAYTKANAIGVYFAGPQRQKLVAVSAKTGELMWVYPHGNFQLVLRPDGLYAMGRTETSKKFDYRTGEILADLQCYRGNCTRATGTVDSIFTRGYRHTGTMRLDVSRSKARRIAVMRPACQDGVVIADAMTYWGPWMCDCNHSLVGMIGLAPAGDFQFSQPARQAERLEIAEDFLPGEALDEDAADWRSYRAGPQRQASCRVSIAEQSRLRWQFQGPAAAEPTAPVTAGGLVFWSGTDGIVRACELETGRLRWTAYTGGAVRFPPEVWQDRLYVGSGDGWVYCLEASSGRQLWRFRAAPQERKIAVHGQLLSTWPVGSGVLLQDGVLYAAAGMASYDGTHVYALDAQNGKIIWQNNTSGHLAGRQQVSGVSVQGHLLLHDGRLYLAAGNVVSPAIYDVRTGQCLNEMRNEWMFAPADQQFPSDPQSSMFRRAPRGRELFLVDGQVRVFDQLLYSPPRYQRARYFGGYFLQASAGATIVRATFNRVVRLSPEKTSDSQPIGLWQNDSFADPRALALCDNVVLVAGKEAASADGPAAYRLSALRLDRGTPLWSQPLPESPVSWGLAVDRRGRVLVTIQDGRVLCFDR